MILVIAEVSVLGFVGKVCKPEVRAASCFLEAQGLKRPWMIGASGTVFILGQKGLLFGPI